MNTLAGREELKRNLARPGRKGRPHDPGAAEPWLLLALTLSPRTPCDGLRLPVIGPPFQVAVARRSAPITREGDTERSNLRMSVSDCRLPAHAFRGTVGQQAGPRAMAHLNSPNSCHVLMVYPGFNAATFWNFSVACELVGARYPAPPLGMITLAATLPPVWDIRLVNRNTEELTDADLAWADIVMTGGMLAQQVDTLQLIALCHAHGKPVAVGGPDPTSSPQVYAAADFRVLGEAEGVIGDFIAAWEAGERSGCFTAPKFTIDVTMSPIPRFDLLKFEHYLYVGVQYSRGCPFTCEFCDIIELYGRVPRAKTAPQILAELETLYQLGYRGHVDFVDDNLIGNKKALKGFLPQLAAWLKARDYPFEFSTEASINMADDDELLNLMRHANFFTVFVGIESPDPKTLDPHQEETKHSAKSGGQRPQDLSRRYVRDRWLHRWLRQRRGFDGRRDGGLHRGIRHSRLHGGAAVCAAQYPAHAATCRRRAAASRPLTWRSPELSDQCTATLNFDTLRPLSEILRDYRRILERVYDPSAFADRLQRLASMLDRSGRPRDLPRGDKRLKVASIEMVHKIIGRLPDAREQFWQAFVNCAKSNPAALRYIVILMAFYLHLGPFARKVIATIDARLAELDLAVAAAPVVEAVTKPDPYREAATPPNSRTSQSAPA